MKHTIATAVLSWLLVSSALAQSLVKQADRQFNEFAYAKAIELYEMVLTNTAPVSEEELRNARAKLGYSYQQMRDMPNAERIYHELTEKGDLPADYARYYLFYAQALASNGKYGQAQEAYEKYNRTQPAIREVAPSLNVNRAPDTREINANNYQVEFLSINSRRAEFSPVLYKNGLVFVGEGHGKGVLGQLLGGSNTRFLDLYFLPDRNAIANSGSAKRGRVKLIQTLGRDKYTALTANDSKTVGSFANSYVGSGYQDQAVSQSDLFGKTLNTKYHEGPATFSRDGLTVIFTRNNYNEGHYRKSTEGVNKLKLYTAVQTNGVWSKAEELPLNSDEFSTGHPSLSKDDQLLYFSSDRPGGLGGSDIYVSKKENGKWGKPVNLGPEVNTKGNELFPFADDSGNLYFSSNERPGLGGLDLFCTALSPDGMLGLATRNMGEPLNSAKDDFGIVTDASRKGGYFSSNRKHGGADDDVYRFVRKGPLYDCRELTVSVVDADSRSPLENTALVMNNAISEQQRELVTDENGRTKICLDVDSDFKFMATHEGYVDTKVGFSTRDLLDDKPSHLEILLAKPKVTAATTLRGHVINQGNKQPLAGVKVVVVNECDGTKQEIATNTEGEYEFVRVPGCDYSVDAAKGEMGTTGTHVTKNGSGTADLVMFKKGDIINIENIHYDRNKATIRPEAAAELDKIVALMKKYPAMAIEMRSHTDSRASTHYNNVLSGNRATAAVSYLKSKGVAASRLIAKGYGESTLLNKCADGVGCSEEEHQQNRRTEIRIMKLD